MKQTIFNKLTSRKFWIGVAGIISGLVIIFGFADSDVETISGAVITIGSAIAYMIAESRVDAKNLGQILEGAETIYEVVTDPDEQDGEE
jgi:hypothetical protein